MTGWNWFVISYGFMKNFKEYSFLHSRHFADVAFPWISIILVFFGILFDANHRYFELLENYLH